jgi:hypothetical protein
MIFTLTLIATLALQVALYLVLTPKLAARHAYCNRLATLHTKPIRHYAAPARNRLGED